MFARFKLHFRQQFVGYIALFIALGGVSYAAVTLPRNSVGPGQIKRRAVKTSDIGKSTVTTGKVQDGSLLSIDFKPGQLPAGQAGPQGAPGPSGPTGPQGATGPAGTEGAPGVPATRLFARVAGKGAAGTTLGPSSGVTALTWNGVGDYSVTFDRDVSRCAPIVNAGYANAGVSEFIGSDVIATTGFLSGGNTVRVLLRHHQNNPPTSADVSFNLAVFC